MSDPTAALRAISGAEPSDTAVGLPNIPAVPFTDDASLTNFLQSAKLWMEKAMGAGLTGFATKQDLIRNGLLGTDAKGNLVPTGGVPNLAIPPVPTGLQANGAMTNILLEWDNPFQAYGNHGYTEIWAAETNNFSGAVMVGESGGFTFAHAVNEDATRYYWIRFVSTSGIKGPYNSVNGTLGQTAPNPQYLLDTLTGQLTESQLYADLSARIDLIDGPSTTIGTIPFQLAQLQGQINDLSNYPTYDNATTYATGDIVTYNGAIYKAKSTTTGNLPTNTTYWLKIGDYSSLADAVAAHTTEIATLTANDAAQASQITSLTATVEGYNATTNAALVAEQTTRANADSALSQQITTLNATVETNQSSLLASLQTEQTTRANADSALSQEITTLTAAVQDNQSSLNSAIQSESTARADADSALTTQVNTAYSAATKTRTYSQNDAPTSDMIEGDLWFDANDGYKAYRYTGTEWSPTDDTRIAGNVAAIESEATTRADETSALATSINILSATVEDNNTTLSAAIDSEATTRADEDAVLAELITAISSRLDTGGDVANAIVQTQATANTAVTNAEAAQGTADSKVRTYAQAEEPTADLVTGDLWIDTGDNNRLYYWDGAQWVDARDTASLSAFDTWITNTYAPDKTTTQGLIDSKVETWFQDSDPAANWTTDELRVQHDGDLWYNATTKLFKRYTRLDVNEGEWTLIEDQAALDAATAASSAQSTANAKITTFYQTETPTALSVGDLWIDTDDNNRLYRWNGSDWVDARDTSANTAFNNWISGTYASNQATLQSQVDAKIETWFQDTDPSAAWTTDTLKIQHDGDLWYSSTSKLFKRYARTGTNAGEWTLIDDATAVSAAAAAAAAQSTADSRITTFYQSSPPDANAVGDLWMDSSDNNRLYRWNGSDWVDAADVRITTTASLVTDIQTTVNDHTTSIQTNAESIDGIQGKYTVKIDNNGYVTGYGLISEDNNGTPTSEFMVVADKFTVAPVTSNLPNYVSNTTYQEGDKVQYNTRVYQAKTTTTGNPPTNTNYWKLAGSPFFYVATDTVIDGVTIPAGVHLDAAYIVDGTITTAQIGNATIDAAKITGLLEANQINGTNLQVVNGTFSGSLQAAKGTFSGALDVKSASTGARLEILTDVIKVYDALGNLRVKIGNLDA